MPGCESCESIPASLQIKAFSDFSLLQFMYFKQTGVPCRKPFLPTPNPPDPRILSVTTTSVQGILLTFSRYSSKGFNICWVEVARVLDTLLTCRIWRTRSSAALHFLQGEQTYAIVLLVLCGYLECHVASWLNSFVHTSNSVIGKHNLCSDSCVQPETSWLYVYTSIACNWVACCNQMVRMWMRFPSSPAKSNAIR